MDEAQFRRQLQERGNGDPRVKEFEPNLDQAMHTHDVSCMLLVTSGEFTLALKDGARTYRPGEWCELEAGTVHMERTGEEGATILLAQKQL